MHTSTASAGVVAAPVAGPSLLRLPHPLGGHRAQLGDLVVSVKRSEDGSTLFLYTHDQDDSNLVAVPTAMVGWLVAALVRAGTKA